MGFNFSCGCYSYKNACNKTRWCEEWKPPPFPWEIIPKERIPENWDIDKLKKNVLEDVGFERYKDECNFTSPDTGASTPPGSTTTQVPVQQQQEVQTASGGIIALIVIIVLVIIIAAAVGIWYLWKRKKKKSASINSLPLKEYNNTNFLDNKARQNQCYRIPTDDKNDNNQYGSFQQAGGESTKAVYINVPNRNSREVKVESPVVFDKMNTSGHSGSLVKTGYDNDNFMNDLDQSGKTSPGASSQTPLFDEIDGTALPNSVPSSRTLSECRTNSIDKSQRKGSLKADRLPPIDMTVNKRDTRKNSDRKNSNSSRKMSDTSLRSPKKKKPAYLQRKSEPVEGLEDITQDMAGNRKKCLALI